MGDVRGRMQGQSVCIRLKSSLYGKIAQNGRYMI